MFRQHRKLLQPKPRNRPVRKSTFRVVPRERGLDDREDRTRVRVVPIPIRDEDDVDVRESLVGDSVSVNSDRNGRDDVSVFEADVVSVEVFPLRFDFGEEPIPLPRRQEASEVVKLVFLDGGRHCHYGLDKKKMLYCFKERSLKWKRQKKGNKERPKEWNKERMKRTELISLFRNRKKEK